MYRLWITCVFVCVLLKNFVNGDFSPYDIGNLTDEKLPSMHLVNFGSKSYYIGDVFQGNFFHAEQFCRYHGMNLVSIESEQENEFLYKEIKKRDDASLHFWTSGTKLPDSSQWIWFTTARHISYFNWSPGEPNKAKINEKCIEIREVNQELRWNDVDCNGNFHFICEFTWSRECYTLLQTITNQPLNNTDVSGMEDTLPDPV